MGMDCLFCFFFLELKVLRYLHWSKAIVFAVSKKFYVCGHWNFEKVNGPPMQQVGFDEKWCESQA